MSYLKKVKKQTGFKQYFKILILCEGRTLPDIDQAAVEEECRNVMIQTGGRDRRDKPANNGGRGWELELPGELMTKLAPLMVVLGTVLPLALKLTTGVMLPDIGLAGGWKMNGGGGAANVSDGAGLL